MEDQHSVLWNILLEREVDQKNKNREQTNKLLNDKGSSFAAMGEKAQPAAPPPPAAPCAMARAHFLGRYRCFGFFFEFQHTLQCQGSGLALIDWSAKIRLKTSERRTTHSIDSRQFVAYHTH